MNMLFLFLNKVMSYRVDPQTSETKATPVVQLFFSLSSYIVETPVTKVYTFLNRIIFGDTTVLSLGYSIIDSRTEHVTFILFFNF